MNALLEVLRHQAHHFAPELARQAHARGLAVTKLDGSTVPIPVTATPVVLEGQEIRHRAELAGLLAQATARMVRMVLEGPDRELLMGALTPVERPIVEATWARVARLVNTRVDFFVDASGARALELNATIPAMQGYSDIAARTFLEVVGRHLRYPERALPALVAANGSNALALYRALLDGFAAERPGESLETVALLCRRNDAQITELRYLAQCFRDFGADAEVVHPDEVDGGPKDDGLYARGKRYQLLYRHLFLRRLEQAPHPWLTELLSSVPSKKVVVINPPASQYEVKTAFALLSQALSEPALARRAGLTDAELEAVRRSVPWTRHFRAGPGTTPDGERVEDLVAYVAAHPDRFVLKRAWDYGGKAVFLGRSRATPAYAERVQAAYGEPLDWAQACARTAADPNGGGFVVQELVDVTPEPHLLCTEGGTVPLELFVDYSCYASIGLQRAPAWGGVCRGSSSEIVNIVGGGGVLPLLTREVADKLLLAWKAL